MEEQTLAANTEEVATLQTSESTQTTAAESAVQQTNETQDVTQTQAFAHRLKDETSKAEQRARDAVIAEMYGETYGIRTYADYQEAIRKQQAEQERQRMKEAGLDPDILKSAIDNHPDVKFARDIRSKQEEDAKFRSEAEALYEQFPDLDAKSIQAEVWQLNSKGVPLLDAYLRVNYKSIQTQAEQAAIAKLTDNAQSTPGALGQGGQPPKMSVKDMPKSDFEAMIARVKRGEQVNL